MIKELWDGPRYTTEELNARLKFFIGIVLGLTLFGIVFVVLYSLIFVTQPMNGMSPVDNKFFELIIPIATFLTGTLSGIMLAGNKPEDQQAMLAAQKQAQENFAETKKAMLTPPPAAPAPRTTVTTTTVRQEPTFQAESTQVVTGFGGKLAPPPAPQPEI